MDKWKLKDLYETLENKPNTEYMKLIYMWVKQNRINLKEFTILVNKYLSKEV